MSWHATGALICAIYFVVGLAWVAYSTRRRRNRRKPGVLGQPSEHCKRPGPEAVTR